MGTPIPNNQDRQIQAVALMPPAKRIARLPVAMLLLALLAAGSGCAAVSNPLANGIPARRVPPELLGESKAGLERLPLTLLRQPPPKAYKLAAGDVLGIWIDGVPGLSEKEKPPPVFERRTQSVSANSGPTTQESVAMGFPFPIRANGTIKLPLVPPIKLDGLTLEQAEEEIRKAYTVTKEVLRPGKGSIIVTLHRPREYHILVIRQDNTVETGASGAAGMGVTGARSVGFLLTMGGGARGARRGAGFSIDLPAYQNDVLSALARTGGLPGTDAADEIIIERGSFQGKEGRRKLVDSFLSCPGSDPLSLAPGTQRIRIPLRYRPSQPLPVRPEDTILQTGDIVFIESREAEVFYAAGFLPAGTYPLPRDTDLDVVNAVLRIGGSIWIDGINTTNITGTFVIPGLGLPRPTLLNVVRQTPGGKQVVIRVDLERALREPRERILVQPNDLLVMQERPQEALGRYLYEILALPFHYTLWNGPRGFGSIGYNAGFTGASPGFP